MGCAASSRILPDPVQVAKDRKATAEFKRQLAKARAAQAANTNAALSFGQLFELICAPAVSCPTPARVVEGLVGKGG